MIEKNYSLAAETRARYSPVAEFLKKASDFAGHQASVLKLDNTDQDIDPREGFVRTGDHGDVAAGADFLRSGDLLPR